VGGQWTIREALRRSLWFTVISAFSYGSGTTIATYVRTTRRQREREKREIYIVQERDRERERDIVRAERKEQAVSICTGNIGCKSQPSNIEMNYCSPSTMHSNTE